MSSATMPSTIPSDWRFRFSDDASDWRRPVTVTCWIDVVGMSPPRLSSVAVVWA